MTSDRRRADIPGVETADTGYMDPDIGWENANSNTSIAPEQDAGDLDSAFQEDKNVDTPASDSTPAASPELDPNLVDHQLGTISRMSG